MSSGAAHSEAFTESPGIRTLESVIGMPKEGREAGRWQRVFTQDGVHPFDEVEWKTVDARIVKPDGSVAFEQKGIEVPSWWTETTINIVADKYLRVVDGVKESSAKQMFSRVARVVTKWADEQNYFNSPKDAEVYEQELIYSLLHQYGAFNSPVWFNIGVPGRKQAASACFISEVDDTVESIMAFQSSEATIFRGGSGSGANLSRIRSSYEKLSSGSYVCGPVGWMEALDKYAKAFKSGGSTRNAAKMVVLDMDHPDVLETKDGRPGFIRCKAVEEKRAHDLIEMGYSAAYDDPNSAYKWVSFQNANHSVSIPDSFMQAVVDDGTWKTRERLTGKEIHSYRARELWTEIAHAAWVCGDPGVQFTDTINRWHTTPNSGRIRSSNPCSEYLNIDNTACNLCAVNLTRFFDGRRFEHRRFEHAVRIFVTAQNAIIAKADYPTEAIAKNSHSNRPIGLNYGDLGSLLMKLGYGYDSDEGRAVAARLASFMTGNAYLVSAKLAARVGPFPEFEKNREPMLNVMRMHREANSDVLRRWGLESDPLGSDVLSRSERLWEEVLKLGEKHGYSVSQATLQAPLGTISFLMGMNTTGIEPAFALVSYKSLVGGGSMKLVNQAVGDALSNLGYGQEEASAICEHLSQAGTLEGGPHLKPEHLPVFDCAMPSGPSGRCISPLGHLRMMAAIQPLITCAQSKTVNLPRTVTPEEIAGLYMEGWKLGLKCVALYRDGCKKSQPLKTKERHAEEGSRGSVRETVREVIREVRVADRRSIPKDSRGRRHRFNISGHKGYLIVGEYPDGTPGEVFVRLGKIGSTMGGLVDSFTKLLSIALQYGVPRDKLIRAFVHTKFEPSGFTDNPRIRFADSLYDYIFKYLDLEYDGGQVTGLNRAYGAADSGPPSIAPPADSEPVPAAPSMNVDAPPCSNCGTIMRRNGSCYLCDSCGSSSGCS